MSLRSIFFSIISAFCLVALAAGAQSGRSCAETFTLKNPRDTVSGPDQQLSMARQLMQRQNFGAAADLLEVVYEKRPQDQVVITLLRACYAQLKQYARAEGLVRKQIAQSPESFGTWLDLAEIQADEGQRDSSLASYRTARKLIPPSDTTRYLTLIRSQITRNMNDQALALIDTLRAQFRDSGLFALEKGQLLEQNKDYRGAVREYGPLLTRDTVYDGMEAERRLLSLLDFVDASKQVEQALQDEAARTNNAAVIRILADHYIKAGQFDKAFSYAVQRDSIFGFQGMSLVAFMRQCYDRKMYREAAQMGDYVLAKFPSGAASVDALLVYANSLKEMGRYQDALTRYGEVVKESPQPQDKGEALCGIGMVYFENLADYRQAITYFDSVATYYPVGLPFINARRMQPYCYMRLGDREHARIGFQQLKTQMLIPDVMEEASYELAMLSFYDQQYDSANVGLRKLIVDYPRGFYVNDALQILMVTDEAKDAPELLGEFGNALWFQECGKDDSSRTYLDRLARNQNPALADDALYRLMVLDLKLNDTTSASDAIERLIDSFPQSYYIPFGMKQKADILALDPGKIDDAKLLYRRILEQYPNYPFVAEVRKRLRQIETDRKIG